MASISSSDGRVLQSQAGRDSSHLRCCAYLNHANLAYGGNFEEDRQSAWTANEENVFTAGLLHYGR
jgi:hypothetical protein